MMEIQPVGNNGKMRRFDNPDKFLEHIDTLLELGYKFSVSVAKESAYLFKELNQLFEKHKIEVVIATDSDPSAAQYLIMALACGVGGAAVGAAALTVAQQIAIRTATFAVPGIGPVVAIGATLGALIGMITGLALTKMGLRVRFSPKNSNVLEIDFIPEST